MPCYCNDIYRITQDIAHLKNMLTKLSTLSQEDSMLTSELSELSGSLSGMATPSNSNSAADKIAQLQKNMAGKTSSLQGAVSGEITRLGSTLTSLRTQDISYHTSLQRLLLEGALPVNFQLNITTLEETVNTLDKVITEAATIDQEFSKAQGDLIRSSWHGKAADRFSVNNGEWKASFKVFRQNIDDVTCLLKKVLPLAKALHREAEGFGAIFGAGTIGQSELLSYCASAKGELTGCCTKLKTRYDTYQRELNELTSISSKLSYSQLSISFDVQSMLTEAKDNQEKLSRLTSAAEAYASGIDELEFMIAQGQGSITRPEGWAQFTGAFFEKIQGMGLGALDALAGSMSVGELLAQLLGLNFTSCAYGGDPVNMATGNFVYEKEFLASKGLMPLSFKMFYNAQEKEQHGLGPGWMHNYLVRIKQEPDKATVILEDGRQEIFIKTNTGAYIQSRSLNTRLHTNKDEMVYTNEDGIRYRFNQSGRLSCKDDRNNNSLSFIYTKEGILEKATSSSGSVFEFTYEKGKLTQVSDGAGRSISLAYTGEALRSITDEGEGVHHFEYDENSQLAKVVNPLGVDLLTNTFNEDGRIAKQVLPDGGTILYSYDDEENKLILTEQNGNEVVYVRDDKFRSIKTIYSDGADSYGYNDMHLRTHHIDKRGNSTRYAYDDKGNLTKVTNAAGEKLCIDYNYLNLPVEVRMCDALIQQASYDNKGNIKELSDALGRTRSFEYNEAGLPTVIVAPDSSETHISYDDRGNILSIKDSNYKVSFCYDELCRPIKTVDGKGNATSYEYNSAGEVAKVVNALGLTKSYEYNQAGQVTKMVDFDDSVISQQYNAIGLVSTVIDQEENASSFEYDQMFNVYKKTDALGNATTYEYNKLNQLVKMTNAKGVKISYAYDPCGNKTQITGPRGEVIQLVYDSLNRVEELIEPNGAKTRYEYNYLGLITKTINALGHEYETVYDEAGQVIARKDPTGRELRYRYNGLGKVEKIVDGEGRTLGVEYYPGSALVKEIVYPDNKSFHFTYDENKQVISKRAQNGYTLFYEYDCLGQITQMTSSEGQKKAWTYDKKGRVISQTDANGNTTTYGYSLTGKLTKVIDALGNMTEYDYDKCGKLQEVRQQGELGEINKLNEQSLEPRVTQYTRDNLGQIEQVIDALGNAEVFTYDPSGNISSQLDKEGYLTEYSFDATNQLEEVVFADGRSVRLSYNPLKQLSEIKDWLGTISIDLDEVGRPKKVIDHLGREVEYSYGPSGQKEAMRYPGGKLVEYAYDEALRLSSLREGSMHVDYHYDENGRLSQKSFSDKVSTHYSYDATGLLASLVHRDQEGILDQYSFVYDNMANKVAVEKSRRGLEEESGHYQYSYDALSRLTAVTKDGKQLKAFSYDSFGNRSSMMAEGIKTEYSYNALNQLLCQVSPLQSLDFSYDARGNLVERLEDGSSLNTYEIDSLNRLAKASNSFGQTASYDYNGLGYRVGKQVSSELDPTKQTSYVLDLTRQYHNLLQTVEDAKTTSYQWDTSVAFSSGSPDGHFYLHDELGSPLRLMSKEGTLLTSYTYDEFGCDISENQGVAQPFGYTGYQFDTVSNTYFAQAREYHPATGIFSSLDRHWNPSNRIFGDAKRKTLFPNPAAIAQSANLYTYCMSNPMSFIDPNAEDAIYMVESDGALGAGHAALAVQDENGSWWLMTFEPKSQTPIFGLPNILDPGVVFVELENIQWKDETERTIISAEYAWQGESWLFCPGDINGNVEKYDHQVFIPGDFTESWIKANELKGENPGYWLTGRNCAWLALELLSFGAEGEAKDNLEKMLWNICLEGTQLEFRFRKTIVPRYDSECVVDALKSTYPGTEAIPLWDEWDSPIWTWK